MKANKKELGQALMVEANWNNLHSLYTAKGFNVEIKGNSDDFKVWATMEVKKGSDLIGVHLFQDGQMVSNLVSNL